MHRYRRGKRTLSAQDRLSIRIDTQLPVINSIVQTHTGKTPLEHGINLADFLTDHDAHQNAWNIIHHLNGDNANG